MEVLTNPSHQFTCKSESERRIWEEHRRELQPRLVEYLRASPYRYFPPKTVVCPQCGATGFITGETSWICSHCGIGGDILDSASYITGCFDYAENIRHIEETLAHPPLLQAYRASSLLDVAFLPTAPLIDGLLYPGLYLLAGAPKVGKSWLVLYLANQISQGLPLWGLKTTPSEVLYFCLEDTFQRLQERIGKVCSTVPSNILLAPECDMLGHGLEEQIEAFAHSRENGRLVIIDTLQKVRVAAGEQYSYSKDYETMGQLKRLADQLELTILVVHHTRKQEATDSFEKISGTQGLMGCADGALVLEKKARTEGRATLKATGRQCQDMELELALDPETMRWELDGKTCALEKTPIALLKALQEVIAEHGPFEGHSSELCALLAPKGFSIDPCVLTRRLNSLVNAMLFDYQLGYETFRTKAGRFIRLEHCPQKESSSQEK